MNKLDAYIDSLYNDLDSKDGNLDEFKLDMKNNLLEAINELIDEGYTEAESIDIVINRMGSKDNLKSEISHLFNVKSFNLKSLILIFLSFILFILIMSFFKFRGFFLPIDLFFALSPIYIIYEIIHLIKYSKKQLIIDKKYEVIKVVFILYIFVLIGKLIFPMYSYINLNNGSVPDLILNPLFSLGMDLVGMIKFIIYFIPIGVLLPILFDNLKSLKSCILVGISIWVVKSIVTFITGILGMNFVNIISVEYLIVYLIGIVIGYYIYSFIFRKKQTSI